MNCNIRWVEQHGGREGFFYSGYTDRPMELPFLDACAYAQEEQAISNKWGRAVCYQVVDSQVVDSQGEIVYNTCQFHTHYCSPTSSRTKASSLLCHHIIPV